jgi:NAD+ synthase (glutamine-hydrolysing)
MPAKKNKGFLNLYNHGFIRAAVCIPELKVADILFNTKKTIELARKAASNKAIIAIFPELGLSAYSNEDLFHQDALLQGVREAIAEIKKASEKINIIIVAGAPLQVDCRLFNCAVVFYKGKIMGMAVKSYLPN